MSILDNFSPRKNTHPATIKSLIGVGTRIKGTVEFSDGLRVDGEVEGNIQWRSAGNEAGDGGALVVSQSGLIKGEIRASQVIVGGHIKGPTYAKGLLVLQPGARVEGDVHYAAIEIHQGAQITGQLLPMSPAASAAAQEPELGPGA